MASEIHVDDVGTVFRVTIIDGSTAVDVSSASTLQFIFLKPDKTKFIVTASPTNTGTDGVIQYITLPGDLSLAGRYEIQAYIVIGTSSWRTESKGFLVYNNL